jgi:hypothetical protein
MQQNAGAPGQGNNVVMLGQSNNVINMYNQPQTGLSGANSGSNRDLRQRVFANPPVGGRAAQLA